MIYENRRDAGKKLASKLKGYEKDPKAVVLGLPRGGVEVAYYVSKDLGLPLDIIVARKIGHPADPELAIGAISDGEVFLEDYVAGNIPEDYIERKIEEERKEAERRVDIYGKSSDLKGKTVILVDDGIATGATMKAAISSVRKKNAGKIIVAVPVAAPEALAEIKADESICLSAPEFFGSVGSFYKEFDQVSDEKVISFLKNHEN